MVENKKDNGGIMAKHKRVTRKQLLKEPDEFMTTTGRIVRWGQQYARPLAYVASAFLILMVVIAGYRYFSNNAENKAFLLLDQAVGKYETQKTGMDVLAAYEGAREDFEYIIRKYDNTEGGKLATVVFAGISYDAGDAEKAIQLYEDALKYFKRDTTYQNFLWSGLGYAYEKKQDARMAVSWFEKIADGKDPVVKDAALFNMGRLYHELGDTAKSKQAYERLTTEHADSMYYQLALEKIAG
jgi:tetratricopeptide (TPR) repeat protein